jgi:SAM-dependent methyltransferase
MNRFHRWYCRTARWRETVERTLMPWVLTGAELGDAVLEIGPGPGLTTDVLRTRTEQLTSVEIDPALAAALRRRLVGSNVRVIEADATALPFADGSFSGAVACTMLHHVPSPAAQDRLLREVWRVLRPGARFVGSDSMTSLLFRLAHLRDTMVLVDPDRFGARLEAAGFHGVAVDRAPSAFRFRATR